MKPAASLDQYDSMISMISMISMLWRRSLVVITNAQLHSTKFWTHVLRRFKSWSRRVGVSRWWGSLTMVPAGNKAKRFSSVNHTKKTIHHHHYHHHRWVKQEPYYVGQVVRLNWWVCFYLLSATYGVVSVK